MGDKPLLEQRENTILMSDKIYIQITPHNFEYDIYTLVKAFYPSSEIEVIQENCSDEINEVNLIEIKFLPDNLSVSFEGKTKTASIDYEDRKSTKNVLKQELYNLLSCTSEKELPWGTLTGIRPVRIPLTMMENGSSRNEIEEFLKETYFMSPEKIELSCNVAELENNILKTIDYKNGYSLYVGIPFCPTICLYCSFTSFTADKWEPYLDEYLDTVEKELQFYSQIMKKAPDSVYIGGGTPTILNPKRLERLLSMIEKYFDVSKVHEYSFEAGRPDTIDEDKLRVLRNHGISRISINPQTMNQRTLDLIGRKHTVNDIVDRFSLARNLGFDNINMDLIVGLPGEGSKEIEETMKRVVAIDPDNITIHSLAIKRATRLNLFKEEYEQIGMVNNQDIMDITEKYVKEAGLYPYYLYRQKNMAGNLENVGYAKKGYEGLYNILIMEEKQTILACGAGSSTKRVFPDGERIERVVNPKDIKTYLNKIDEIIEKKRILLEA